MRKTSYKWYYDFMALHTWDRTCSRKMIAAENLCKNPHKCSAVLKSFNNDHHFHRLPWNFAWGQPANTDRVIDRIVILLCIDRFDDQLAGLQITAACLIAQSIDQLIEWLIDWLNDVAVTAAYFLSNVCSRIDNFSKVAYKFIESREEPNY